MEHSLNEWNEELTVDQAHLALTMDRVRTGMHLNADLNSNSFLMTKQRYEDELVLLKQDFKSIAENVAWKLNCLDKLTERFKNLRKGYNMEALEVDKELNELDGDEFNSLIHNVSKPWIESLNYLTHNLPDVLA